MPKTKHSEELTAEEAKRELVRCRVIRDRLALGDLVRQAYPSRRVWLAVEDPS